MATKPEIGIARLFEDFMVEAWNAEWPIYKVCQNPLVVAERLFQGRIERDPAQPLVAFAQFPDGSRVEMMLDDEGIGYSVTAAD